jgi:hypothetical protein
MLKFFSASTRTVISKTAIAECPENALQGEACLHQITLSLFLMYRYRNSSEILKLWKTNHPMMN